MMPTNLMRERYSSEFNKWIGELGSLGKEMMDSIAKMTVERLDLMSDIFEQNIKSHRRDALLTKECSVTITGPFAYFGAIRLKGYAKTLHI